MTGKHLHCDEYGLNLNLKDNIDEMREKALNISKMTNVVIN